jgi:hypothetical protein
MGISAKNLSDEWNEGKRKDAWNQAKNRLPATNTMSSISGKDGAIL